MTYSASKSTDLSLTPLGAGDLIDRSVRFYRRNFWTFVLIASPPVVAGTIFFVGWMYLGRSIFSVDSRDQFEIALYSIYIGFGNLLIWFIQIIAILVVMGGASRNFVRHTLFGEPITFRETYRNARSRLLPLTGVSILLVLFLGIVLIVIFYPGLVIAILGIGVVAILLQSVPFLAFIVSVAVALAVITGMLWLFFLLVSRFVYVPQVMLVEGLGAFAAIGRSASLAGKNVKRVAALFIFTIVATYSALSLLYVPLSFYAWAKGVNFFTFDAADTIPAWYEISSQVVFQGSLILIIPVLMIGLCLLYVDERVKREGYDIELMAASRLGEMPPVPPEFVNPLQPALSATAAGRRDAKSKGSSGKLTTLGLE